MATIAAFGMMVTVSTAIGTGFTVVPGTKRFGVGAGQYLVWFSIFMIASAVVYAFTGNLVKRHGARIVSIVGSIGVAVSYTGMALSPTISVFYLWSAVLGIAWTGCTFLMATHLTTAWHTHRRRGTVVGIVAMGGGTGGFLWGLVFPPIVAAGGFTGAFVALAGFVVVFAVLPAVFLVREPKIENAAKPLDGAETARHKKALRTGFVGVTILLCLAFFLFSLESVFGSVQPAVFANLGIAPTTAGLLFSMYNLSALIAKPILGYSYDRLGVIALYTALVILFVLGLPSVALFGRLGGGILFALIPITALSISVPTVVLPLITVRSVGQARFPLVYGTSLSVLSLGSAVAAPIWGVTFDLTGSYNLAMYGGGAAGIVGVIVSYFAYRIGHKRNGAENAVAETDSVGSVFPANK
ncbi:MFS transporter [Amycolatopsis pithecellobii]|nr:MFS transporter [Amycolatopsis pithecellobii]